MATIKKKIEKRWRLTTWSFNPQTKEVILTKYAITKPMTERRARALVQQEIGAETCWKIERHYR